MYDVVYLPMARQQIMEAVLYIADELSAPDAAEGLLTKVDEQIGSLCENPYRFPLYHTLYAMNHEIRFFPVKNYNVFYIVKEEQKTVEIWRFLHQRQNAGKHLQAD